MKLTLKVYKDNLETFYDRVVVKGQELHHTCGRVGVLLCCPLLWVSAKKCHTDDFVWVNKMRKQYEPIKKKVLANFTRFLGCKKQLCLICRECRMPRQDRGDW